MSNITFEKVWHDLGRIFETKKTINTLSRERPNKVISFSDEGIEVITEKSAPNSHLVPKWMFERAVEHLLEHANLSNSTLVNELNAKRSSFVLAALSRLDYVGYRRRPLQIFLQE